MADRTHSLFTSETRDEYAAHYYARESRFIKKRKFALVVYLRESHVSLQFQLTKRTKQAIVALTGRYVPMLSPPLILTHGCLSSFADFAGLSFYVTF